MIRFTSKTYVHILGMLMATFSLSKAMDIYCPTVKYPDIETAVNSASDQDRVVLVGNVTGTFTMNNPITVIGNGYFIDLTERIRISSSGASIYNAYIQAPPYGNAIRVDAGCYNVSINYCYIVGNWQGGGNWAIDDWGSSFLNIDNTISWGFQSTIDALNPGPTFIKNNCNFYSEGTAVNQYWYEQKEGGCLYENSYLCFSGSEGIRLQFITNPPIDNSVTLRNSTFYPFSDGYSVVGSGPVHLWIQNNDFINCNHVPYLLLNGAELNEYSRKLNDGCAP